MQSQSFFYKQKILRTDFVFHKLVRKMYVMPLFRFFKIYNFVAKSVILFIARESIKILHEIS